MQAEDQLLDSLIQKKTSRPAKDVYGGVSDWYKSTFKSDIPVKNLGASDFERKAGWEHSRAFDVGLHPDTDQGRQLISYLNSQGIPYSAFTGAISKGGKTVATGPHIHVGPPSHAEGAPAAEDELLDSLLSQKVSRETPQPDLTTSDTQWHFGERLANPSPKAIKVLQEAVAEDERKKAAGQTIAPPPREYQNEMRKRAGLPPLRAMSYADLKREEYPKDLSLGELRQSEDVPIGFSKQGQPSRVNQTSDELRVMKGEQPLDRQAYARQQDAQVRISKMRELGNDYDPKKEKLWRAANEPAIRQQMQQYRNEIHGDATKWLSELILKTESGLGELAAGLTGSDELRIKSEAAARAAAAEGADRNVVSQFIQNLGSGLLSSAPELAAMKLGVNPVTTFAAGGALHAGGGGRDPVAGAAHGALTGAAFDLPIPSRIVNPLLRGAAKAGEVGTATTALELASGQPLKESLTTGATNAVMAGVPAITEVPHAIPERPLTVQDIVHHSNFQPRSETGTFKEGKPTYPEGWVVLNQAEVANGAKPKLGYRPQGENNAVSQGQVAKSNQQQRQGTEVSGSQAIPSRSDSTQGGREIQAGQIIQSGDLTLDAVRKVAGFKTSQGSTYTVSGESTQRTKSPHQMHDPADVGLKEPSERTVYVSPEDATRIGAHATLNPEAQARVKLTDEGILLTSKYGREADGRTYTKTKTEIIPYTATPEVGRAPVEFLPRGKVHPGNEITELRGSSTEPSVREGEKVYLDADVKSSILGKLADPNTYLNVERSSSAPLVGTPDGEGGLFVRPNPALGYDKSVLRNVFPDITPAQFEQGVEPVHLVKSTDGRWMVDKPSPQVEAVPPSREAVQHANDISTAIESGNHTEAIKILDELGVTNADIETALKSKGQTAPPAEPVGKGATTETSQPPSRNDSEVERSFPQSLEEAGLPKGSDLYYNVKSHAETDAGAQRLIAERGEQQATLDVLQAQKLTPELVRTGQILIRRLDDAGKNVDADALAESLSRKGTEYGQVIDAFSMVEARTPKEIASYVERQVQKTQPDFKMTPEDRASMETLAKDFQKFKDESGSIIADLQSRVGKLESKPPSRLAVKAAGLVARLDSAAEQAKANIAETKRKMEAGELEFKNTGPVPGHIAAHYADYVTIGAAKIAKGGLSIAQWTDEMASEFGDWVKDDFKRLYHESYKLYDGEKSADKTAQAARATEGMTPTEAKQKLRELSAARVNMRHARIEMQELYQTMNRSPAERFGAKVMDAANAPRALMSSSDLSEALRQNSVFSLTEFKLAKQHAEKLFGSLSESKYQDLMSEIESSPEFLKVRDLMNVSFTSPELKRGHGLSSFDEYFPSQMAEKVPLIGAVVRASERAFTGPLDWARMTWGERFSKEIEEYAAANDWSEARTTEALKQAGKFINAATGRGEFSGKASALNEYLPFLNTVFFSPRYQLSRLQLLNMSLNPVAIMRMEAPVRNIVMRKMWRYYGTQAAIQVGASAIGAQTNETDPNNPDWLKLKIGNTRYDMNAGLQQNMRILYTMSGAFAKLAAAEAQGDKKSIADAKQEVVGRGEYFLRSKLAPIPSFGVDYLSGSTINKQPFEWKTAAVTRLVPLYLQDMYDGWKQENGISGVAKGAAKSVPAIFGVGMQTYDDRGSHRPPSRPSQSSVPTRPQ